MEEVKEVDNKLSIEQRVEVTPINYVCVCVDSLGAICLYAVASVMLHSAGENRDFQNIRELRGAFLFNKEEERPTNPSVNRDSKLKLPNKTRVTAKRNNAPTSACSLVL